MGSLYLVDSILGKLMTISGGSMTMGLITNHMSVDALNLMNSDSGFIISGLFNIRYKV